MIKERYCSLEVAKLLREKGFNEGCYTYYDDIDDSINRFDKGYHFTNTSYPWGVPYDISTAKKYVVAPTQQMAMDWLREVHNIDICVFPYESDYISWDYKAKIYKNKEMYLTITGFKIYKESCEAAIKYCLENLI